MIVVPGLLAAIALVCAKAALAAPPLPPAVFAVEEQPATSTPAVAQDAAPVVVAATDLPPAVAETGSKPPQDFSIANDAAEADVFVGGEPGEISLDDAPTSMDQYGWVFAAEITAGARYYWQDGPFPDWAYDKIPGLKDDDFFPFLSGQTKLTHTSKDGRTRLTFETYARYDFENEYGVIDLPEANIYYDGGTWSILGGMHKEFWGVAESRHLVNIINPIDLDGDPVFENRLGQPMVNYNYTGDFGTISLYGLIGFREVSFEGALDRYPTDWIINEGAAEFEDGDWRHLGFAARYSNTLNLPSSSLDYALSFFTGTDRYPRLVPAFDIHEKPPVFLAPVYDHIDQVGAELLYSINALQLKFEGIYRRQNGDNVFAAIGGFEYTFNSILNTDFDVGLIGEYTYDTRDDFLQTDYPVSNAMFAGFRLTMNNLYNTNVLGGMSYDFDDEARFWLLNASTRITESTQINLEARIFDNFSKDDGSFLLNNEDYVELSITQFF